LRDFERFIRICATRAGNLVNLSGLASDVGISGTTARQWLGVLEASNIIHLLPPFFNNLGKRLIKAPKLYFKDTGLLCFLLGLSSPEQMTASPFIGAVWESFVLGQLHRRREAAGSPAEVYFWRDAHGLEVDFAVWLNGRLQLVEVKWAENGGEARALKPMHEVRSLLGNLGSDRHLVVTRTPMDHWHPHDPSVRVVNGFRFRDWFDLPEPDSSVLRETPSAFRSSLARRKVRAPARAKKK
jgi:predicted AAA+ superfamily ATPase